MKEAKPFLVFALCIFIIGGVFFIFATKVDNAEETAARRWWHLEHLRSVGVARFHDDEKDATCWLAYQGVSCIPDSQLSTTYPVPYNGPNGRPLR